MEDGSVVNSTSTESVESPSTPEVMEQAGSDVVASDSSSTPQATAEQEANKVVEPDILQQLIDSKYKGNRAEFVKGLHEGWQSTAALAKKLEKLESQLSQTKSQAPPEPLENNEDYSALKSEITVLDNQLKANDSTRKQILGSFNSLNQELAILEGQLRATQDPGQKNALAFEKWQKQQEQKQLESAWNTTFKEDMAAQREIKLVNRQLKEVEKAINHSRTQQQTQWQEDAREQQGFLQNFNSAVDAICQEKGIAADSTTRNYLYETLKAQAFYHLSSSKGQAIDPFEFVKKQADAYFVSSGLNTKQTFQQQTAAKLAVQKPVASKALPNVAPQKGQPPRFKSGDEAREYALKRLQAVGSKTR